VGATSPTAGTWDTCAFEPARLIEGDRVVAIPVGPPLAWDEPVAFLDGLQRTELLAYADTWPLCTADVTAAVRIREGGVLRTVVEVRRTLLIGRANALEAAAVEAENLEFVTLPDHPDVPPLRDIGLAGEAVDVARATLEREAGRLFRAAHPGTWLLVDGTLATNPAWLRDPRAIGICRHHARLPFEGEDLRTYLRLASGHRTPVFAPPARNGIEYRAWAMRLRAWEGEDLLHGLIRVEVGRENGSAAAADWLSPRLLAERAPLPAAVAGADRMLYPLQGVRDYLAARLG
jgi:hypothetical protein